MSFSPVLTMVIGALWLKEIPNHIQVMGVGVLLAGMGLFFSSGIEAVQVKGFGFLMISMVSMVFFWILSRKLARENTISTLPLTAIPLGLGGGLLIIVSVPLEGFVSLQPEFWILVALMVVFSTCMSFMLYNYALRTLTAFEMNVLISTVPLITALLAVVFLGETLGTIQLLGMFVAFIGVMLVQFQR